MDNWPPYDIIKQDEDSYRIVMAVAGFDRDELTLTDRSNLLIVSGAKKNGPQDCVYLHKAPPNASSNAVLSSPTT